MWNVHLRKTDYNESLKYLWKIWPVIVTIKLETFYWNYIKVLSNVKVFTSSVELILKIKTQIWQISCWNFSNKRQVLNKRHCIVSYSPIRIFHPISIAQATFLIRNIPTFANEIKFFQVKETNGRQNNAKYLFSTKQ